MRRILTTLEKAYRVPVDFEFALNRGKLHVLQCRPLGSREEGAHHPVPDDVPSTDKIFSANHWVNNAYIQHLDYVVLIDPKDYAGIPTVEKRVDVARVVGRLNDALDGKAFVLMGPGRWGSRDLRLGIPVDFGDICHASALVEIAREHDGYVPEPSFGTHFFQELVEAGIHYLPLYPDAPGVVFNESFLKDSPNALCDLVGADECLEQIVRVIDVAAVRPGRKLELVMDGELQEALCFVR